MHGFLKQLADGIFDPDAVKVLTGAFDDAWASVQASKAPWATDDYALAARTIIANRHRQSRKLKSAIAGRWRAFVSGEAEIAEESAEWPVLIFFFGKLRELWLQHMKPGPSSRPQVPASSGQNGSLTSKLDLEP
jgi:hypothetical protein